MQPFDLTKIRTYSLHERPSKVMVSDLGVPIAPNCTIANWIDNLPKQLAAVELRKVRDYVVERYKAGKLIAVALGGHVIKTGCGPYLIDLIERGIIHAVAMNGSAAIHDFELAYAGKTSEDVGAQLAKGDFGMARETAEIFAQAAQYAASYHCGFGHALGWHINSVWKCPYTQHSLLATAYRCQIPCTVHVAIGTDIVHMHPQIDGATLGTAAVTDFHILCTVVSQLEGGVWFNIGSAVIMPEVFLKAVAVAKNCGYELNNLVTVNFDKESKYRTAMNVLRRPGGEGIEIIGHHEILIPLWHASILANLMKATLYDKSINESEEKTSEKNSCIKNIKDQKRPAA